MPALIQPEHWPISTGVNRIAVELAFDTAEQVESPWCFFGGCHHYFVREPVVNCIGKVLRGDGRVDLKQGDLPQGANAGIGPAGAVDVSSDSDEIRKGFDKLTLDGSLARLYLPATIPAAIVLHGEFYLANSHAGY